jgi:DNA-binding NarL/FixJ family response regulator
MSGSPVFSVSLRQWLQSGQQALPCCLFGERETGWDPHAPPSGSVLIAPLGWREMAFWLPALQQHYAFHPWLFYADLRLAGMFLSTMEGRLCTLVAPASPSDHLRLSLDALTGGVALCPPALLSQLVACGAPASAGRRSARPTRREIECGCAASLGLTNRQIAIALRLQEGTVKTHMHHLLRKLHMKGREELSVYLEQALTPLPGHTGA